MEQKPKISETRILVGLSIATLIAVLFLAYKIENDQKKVLEEIRIKDSQLTKQQLEMKYSVVLGEIIKFDKYGKKAQIKTSLVYPATNQQEYAKQLENCGFRMYQERSKGIRAFCVKGETLTNEDFFVPFNIPHDHKR
jgi:hypothetical protein